MMETSPFWSALQELFRALLVLLSGGVSSGANEVPPDELAKMAHLPSQQALLFLEPDGELCDEDALSLELRLNTMNISAQPVEKTNRHLIFHLSGPLPDNEEMERIVNPGRLKMAAIDRTEEWFNLIPDELRQGLDFAKLPPTHGIAPALSSADKATLQQATPYLLENGLEPFIYEWRESPETAATVRYFLGVLRSESSISDFMWQAAHIEKDAYSPERYNIHMLLNNQGQALLKKLTGDNIGKPVVMVLDGDALTIPIVVEQITSGKTLVVTPSSGFNSDLTDHAREILLLNAVLNHGPLRTPWKIVHMERVP